eukprot:3232479-Prymnesium_polylepis.3
MLVAGDTVECAEDGIKRWHLYVSPVPHKREHKLGTSNLEHASLANAAAGRSRAIERPAVGARQWLDRCAHTREAVLTARSLGDAVTRRQVGVDALLRGHHQVEYLAARIKSDVGEACLPTRKWRIRGGA